ncbi:MAG: type II secretion system protein J [Candidatus Paceibacteria bacterium]
MKYQFRQKQIHGFTLIEMLVSLALFTIVSTITVGALLSLIGGNQRLVKQQTLTSSAIFSLDNMTREIRTGNYYYCGDSAASRGVTAVLDCVNGSTGMSFVESSTRASAGGRVSYYFSSNSLWRRIGSGGTAERLLPDDVRIDTGASRFYVTGTPTLTGSSDVQQPVVTVVMVLAGTADTEPVTLQTTITQRSLDI